MRLYRLEVLHSSDDLSRALTSDGEELLVAGLEAVDVEIDDLLSLRLSDLPVTIVERFAHTDSQSSTLA